MKQCHKVLTNRNCDSRITHPIKFLYKYKSRRKILSVNKDNTLALKKKKGIFYHTEGKLNQDSEGQGEAV